MRKQSSSKARGNAEVDAIVNHLIQLESRGMGNEALLVAEQALRKYPQQVPLFNAVAVISINLGRAEQAVQYWQHCVRLQPQAFLAHLNLSRYYYNSGRLAEAETSVAQALSLKPAHIEALVIQSALLQARGRFEQAIGNYRRILAIEPANKDALNNLGISLLTLRKYPEAVQCFERLATLPGQKSLALTRLGRVADAQNNPDQAMVLLTQALELDPHNIPALISLVKLHAARKSFELPQIWLHKALADKGPNGALLSVLGDLLARQGCLTEARAVLAQAAPLALDANSQLDLARAYYHAGELELASQLLHTLLANNTDNAAAQAILSLVALSQGDYASGWQHYDRRLDTEHAVVSPDPASRWRGQSLAGKTLLIVREQGFGDEIQFFRFLPLLYRQQNCRIVFLCADPLKPLFNQQDAIEIGSYAEFGGQWPPHDAWEYLLSVPRHMKTRLDSLPASIPYLVAPADKVRYWQTRLPQGLRVGLVWKGNPEHDNDHHRSLPSLVSLEELWQVPDVYFISLQKGAGEDEVKIPPATQPLLDLGHELADFGDTAAVITQLDLLICIDSAIAHLGGALGVPCWLMLPAVLTDWRWLREREDSPWYPSVLRLYRQTNPGDWRSLVKRLRHDLHAWVEQR